MRFIDMQMKVTPTAAKVGQKKPAKMEGAVGPPGSLAPGCGEAEATFGRTTGVIGQDSGQHA